MNMFKGTNASGFFASAHSLVGDEQWVFPEIPVRHVYFEALAWRLFHSKHVSPRKGLKGSIKPKLSELMFFCRLIPISLWGGSLLAVAWGVMLCQLGNDYAIVLALNNSNSEIGLSHE
ncbi:hypothetical protein [Pseudomonas capeferrum]